ncbi:MAG: hypothetical protein ACJ8F1_12865, partial [Polyangia bacterium]
RPRGTAAPGAGGPGPGSGSPAGGGTPRGGGAAGSWRPHAGAGRGDGPSDKRTVWVLRDGRPQVVPIRIGMSDGSTTEVAEGDLHEGDSLILDASTSEPASAPPTGPGGGVRRLF